jgi:hypothetical protein
MHEPYHHGKRDAILVLKVRAKKAVICYNRKKFGGNEGERYPHRKSENKE